MYCWWYTSEQHSGVVCFPPICIVTNILTGGVPHFLQGGLRTSLLCGWNHYCKKVNQTKRMQQNIIFSNFEFWSGSRKGIKWKSYLIGNDFKYFQDVHRNVDHHQRFLFPIHFQGGKKDKQSNYVFMIRNDFAPKRLSVPRLESKPAPEQTLQKWRLPSKKLKTDPVQALQCNAWEPRQAQNSYPTQEERSLKKACLFS